VIPVRDWGWYPNGNCPQEFSSLAPFIPFHPIRHYGLLGPAGKAARLAQARAALAVPAPDPVIVESVAAFLRRIDRIGWTRCTHCGQGTFVPTAALPPTPPRGPFSRGPPAIRGQ
jgi:hypothetical protein